MFRNITQVCLILVITIACGRPSSDIPTIPMTATTQWGAFEDSVATGGGLITDFIIRSNGRISGADYQGDRILHYGTDGTFLGTLGREGAGPLEFRSPQEIDVQGDTLYVHDNGNHRVVVIGPGDELLRMVTLNPPRVIPTSFSVGPGGWIFGATRGYTPDGLLVVWAPDGRQHAILGELEHDATMLFDGELVKETALKGGVAPFLLNWATAQATSDGDVILIFIAQARAIKFTRDGSVICDRRLDIPEYEEIFTAYVAANRQSARGEVLTLWRDTAADEAGGCWLLLDLDAPLTVFHLNSDGYLTERLSGPDFSANRIHPYNGDMWAYDSRIETFLRLSRGIVPQP